MKRAILIILIYISVANTYGQMNKSERYERGWSKLQQIDGEAGEKVVNGLKDISPELGQFILEYSFGDVYSLDLLDNQQKEIVAISSLITQRAIPELKVHLNGALNTGNTINEVKEIILQMSAYVGFPKCISAMHALEEVLVERKENGIIDKEGIKPTLSHNTDRYKVGAEALATLDKEQEQILKNAYGNFSPQLVQYVIEYGYADIFSRDNLDKKHRQIATISALATLGNAQPQLKFHIKAGLNIGLTAEDINGIMLLLTVYAGFPAAINGTNILKEVMTERQGAPIQ